MLSRVVASAAARSISSATRRIQPSPLDRRSALRIPFLAMPQQQQQGNGEAEHGGDRRALSTSADDVRSSKKALRSTISATLQALSDEEMARQSESLTCKG